MKRLIRSSLGQPSSPGYGYSMFQPASPLTLAEGATQIIQPQGGFYRVQWRRERGQPLPSGIYQNGNGLQISGARPDHTGTYYFEYIGPSGEPIVVPYEIRVVGGGRHPPATGKLLCHIHNHNLFMYIDI